MPIPPRLYTGPVVPTIYDPTWQGYTNLTPAQRLAFEAFPQDLVRYALTQRWLAEIATLSVTVNGVVLQIDMSDRGQARVDKLARKWGSNATAVIAFMDITNKVYNLSAAHLIVIDDAVTNRIEQLHTALGSLLSGIDARTVTMRKQIDAAFMRTQT